MSREEVFNEAGHILAEFPNFWAVDENIYHLYGVVEKTGVKEFTVEVLFPSDFPEQPPEIRFSNEIIETIGRVQLRTLKNWTRNSSVVAVLQELKMKIDQNLEHDFLELKTAPKEREAKSYSDFATPEPFEFQGTKKDDLSVKPVTRPANDYSSEKPEDVDEPVIIPVDKRWSEEGLVQQQGGQQLDMYDEEFWSGNSAEPSRPVSLTGDAERDARLKDQLDKITMEYSVDYQENFTEINIYLTVSLESTFIIKIDFLHYPDHPKITLPSELNSIISDPYSELKVLRNWNPSNPPQVVELIRELEGKLWSLNDIEKQIKKIFGEFEAYYLPNSKTAVKVTILTYGFQEFQIEIELKDYPSPPTIKYGPSLAALIKTPPEKLKVIDHWDVVPEKEAVAILREINWLVDKESRMAFEIDLLRGSLKEVNYDPLSHKIVAKLKGTMKTEEKLFEFEARLPDNYPMAPPEVKLLSEMDDEKMEEKMNASVKGLLGKWVPSSSYLIDIFNNISKSIFEVSVITCIICHKFECPACGAPLDSPDLNDVTCKEMCDYCERSYHKHCWDQTIASFGKCGFCLRPPPPHKMPS
ncbi:MAG: hypothetical protein ACFFCS_25130 [Candidatus Hodarchaeota archaeon]